MDSLGGALGVQEKSLRNQNVGGEVHGRQIQDSNMDDVTGGAQVAETTPCLKDGACNFSSLISPDGSAPPL